MEKLLLELVTGHCQQITLQQSSLNETKQQMIELSAKYQCE